MLSSAAVTEARVSTWLLWSLISIVTGNPLLAAGVVLLLWVLGDRATFRLLPDLGRWFSRHDRMAKLRQALDVNPHDRRARFQLAELLLERGAPREAAALLRPNLEAGDRDVHTLAALGTALARMGSHEEAERLLADARRLDPEFRMGELDLVLGRMRLELGDAAGAREPLTRLLTARPGTVEGRYQLARALDRLGDAPAAARLREEAWREYLLQPRFRRREDRRWAWRIKPWRPALVALVVLLALLLVGRALSGAVDDRAPRRPAPHHELE